MTRQTILALVVSAFCFSTNAQQFVIEDWLNLNEPTPIELSPGGDKVLWYNGELNALEVQSINERRLKRFALKSGERFVDARFTDETYILLHTQNGTYHRVFGVDSENSIIKLLIEEKESLSIGGNRASASGFWVLQSNQMRWFSFDKWQFSESLALPEFSLAVKQDGNNQPCVAITRSGDVWWYRSSKWQSIKQLENITRVEPVNQCNELIAVARSGNTQALQLLTESNQTKLLFRHNEFDISDVWIDAVEDKVGGVFYHSALPQVKASSQSMAQLQAILNTLEVNSYWQVLDQSDSGTHWLLALESPTRPISFYWVDSSAAKVKVLSQSMADESKKITWAKTHVLETRVKGFNVTGYLTLPNAANASTPLVVRFHGGPFAVRDFWRFDPEAQWFASKGIAFLTINYRGSSGFGLSYQKSAFGNLREVIEQDLEQMLSQVKRSFQLSKSPICLYGASFGGYAVLSELIENSDEYRCGILVSSVTSLPLIYESLENESDKQIFQQQFGSPINEEWKVKNNLLLQLDEVEKPVLVIYGTEDEKVSPQHSELLVEGLKRRNKSVTVLAISGADHQISRASDRIDLYQRITEFLKQLGF